MNSRLLEQQTNSVKCVCAFDHWIPQRQAVTRLSPYDMVYTIWCQQSWSIWGKIIRSLLLY